MPKTIAHLVSGSSCRADLAAARPPASLAQQGATGIGVPIAGISEIGGGSMRNGPDAVSARRFRGIARGAAQPGVVLAMEERPSPKNAAQHAGRDVVAFGGALPCDCRTQGRGPRRDDTCAVANEDSSDGVALPASVA